MHLKNLIHRRTQGGTLVTVLVIGSVASITLASMLTISSTSLRNSHGRADWQAAFYHAENALQAAAQGIADASPSAASNYLSTARGSLSVPYMATARSDAASGFKNAWVTIVRTNAGLSDTYLVTASAKVNNKVRTIQAVIRKNPPSHVFDYEYFLNNWGWWWGDTITGDGGNRSNWDFDFRYNPQVNGEILANGNITQNGVPVDPLASSPPFSGLAGSDPLSLVHSGAPRLEMPNLKDFSVYQSKALTDTSANSLWIGNSKLVAGVHTNASKPGLYLVGTTANPIVISNTVVVSGDVVIKGVITGKGTLYVGGNLYVAGDLTYKNGPDWSVPPETMTSTNRDQWVADNQNKDLIGFAVKGSILAGDVTSSEWKSYCFDPAGYGLSHVGDESHLGADGIAGTPDDNIPFLHSDGTMSTWYDADGDGLVHSAYDYNNDVTMNSSRAVTIYGYPTNNSGGLADYNSVASNDMNKLDAIFYTNHAAAMRLARNDALFHGVIVSRDEAIVFNNTCLFEYDSRVHSRYNNDPNRFVDLDLPVALSLSIGSFSELPANVAGL